MVQLQTLVFMKVSILIPHQKQIRFPMVIRIQLKLILALQPIPSLHTGNLLRVHHRSTMNMQSGLIQKLMMLWIGR